MDIHHRRSIRLKGYDYSRCGWYSLTLCCQTREYFFGEIIDREMVCNDAGTMVKKWFYELENKFTDIQCDTMVVMPDHIHFIVNHIATKNNDVKNMIVKNAVVKNTGVENAGVVGAVGADLCVCPNFNSNPTPNPQPQTSPVTGETSPVTGETSPVQGEHAGSPLHRVVQWFKTMKTNDYFGV
jgi:putative transposase